MGFTKKYRRKPVAKTEPVWTKFEILKCFIYGFILVTVVLIFGNRELFLHNVTGLLYRLKMVEKIYEPKTEKDPRIQSMLAVLNARMEKSYGNPYRITTFKQPDSVHHSYKPPSKVVTPDEVDYFYYSANDIGVKKGSWDETESDFDVYGTRQHFDRSKIDTKALETERLRSILPGLDSSLNPALRYQGSFLDLSGEVHVDHHGIWRKEKKEQTELNTYQEADEMIFDKLEPLAACPNMAHNWSLLIEPKLKLDPTKFLTGTYIWGPNNQSRGLRELVLMAIKMNRTLSLPPFFKHWGTDTSIEEKSTPVDAYTRLDIDGLRALLPVVMPEQMATACDHNIDAYWAARRDFCHGDKVNRIHYFSNNLGYGALNITDLDHTNLDTYHCIVENGQVHPDWTELPPKQGALLPTSLSGLNAIYPNNEKDKCTFFIMPYRAFNFKDVMIDSDKLDVRADIRANFQDDENMYPESLTIEDQAVMGDIVRSTLRPKYVRDLAEQFAKDMLNGTNYVAIHWRYNIGDWTRHCRRKPSIQCDIVQRIVTDIEFVASNIVNYVQTYNYLDQRQIKHKNFMEGKFAAGYFEGDDSDSERPHVVYISHPPDQINFVDGIKNHIQTIAPELKIVSGRDSFNYFSKYFSNCEEILEELHDMHSMIDQEMCLRSQTFLWAVGSSWSTNVLLERHLHGNIHGDAKNTDIFQHALMNGK